MIGKCPDRGTILVKNLSSFSRSHFERSIDVKHRCPSCTKKWHSSSQLEWEKEE